ncbi:macro domain-containing protein [Actinomyces wuliandei]|uniref:macro domain-containing protein n=1 Tax=Actinomyces wuliandei TaxID=2057743 RepID=UPI000FD6BA61|nr:macro domain-containing protein [Actinomyces wuliandei]
MVVGVLPGSGHATRHASATSRTQRVLDAVGKRRLTLGGSARSAASPADASAASPAVLPAAWKETARSSADRSRLVRRLVYALTSEEVQGRPLWTDVTIPTDPDELRALLGFILTTRPPGALPADFAADLDALLEAEAAERGRVEAMSLPPLAVTHRVGGRLGRVLALWRGNLVRLRADAVLNSARPRMLGCFVPGHDCTDNAVHAAAGPALRQECDSYMRQAERFDPRRRSAGEPPGGAVLTGGYHLPAKYVIHTVGPAIELGAAPSVQDRRVLAACYTSALDVAVAAGLGSIGLCAVSTGAFGYPAEMVGLVAMEAVVSWVAQHPDSPLRIVLCASTAAEAAAYEGALAPLP